MLEESISHHHLGSSHLYNHLPLLSMQVPVRLSSLRRSSSYSLHIYASLLPQLYSVASRPRIGEIYESFFVFTWSRRLILSTTFKLATFDLPRHAAHRRTSSGPQCRRTSYKNALYTLKERTVCGVVEILLYREISGAESPAPHLSHLQNHRPRGNWASPWYAGWYKDTPLGNRGSWISW